MKTYIITGMSGAGKSVTTQILEDFGVFCIDNVPVNLVSTFIKLCESNQEMEKVAIVTDIRGGLYKDNLRAEFIDYLKQNPEIEIIFLETDDEVLISRYQETRRRHPLHKGGGSTGQCIALERQTLVAIKAMSDFVINTTTRSLKELREKLKTILNTDFDEEKMRINLVSFGFKYGIVLSADYIFDVRFLPNPFYKKDLRAFTGKDKPVQNYVMGFKEAEEFLKRLYNFVSWVVPHYRHIGKSTVEIGIGCTGGQHRSVTMTTLLGRQLTEAGFNVHMEDRDIKKDREKEY